MQTTTDMKQSTIPKKMRVEMQLDTFYHTCARREALHDHECERDPLNQQKPVEWEHALYYAGSKVQEKFAIVPICYWAHRGAGMNKQINEWIALNRATNDELLELSRKGGKDYFIYRSYLNKRYGVYNPVEKYVEKGVHNAGINYGQCVDKEAWV